MTGTFSFLRDVKMIQGCPVGLSDVSTVEATYESHVIFVGNLKLDHVLFVPKLDWNLISVPQLLDSANCIVQFTKRLCVSLFII